MQSLVQGTNGLVLCGVRMSLCGCLMCLCCACLMPGGVCHWVSVSVCEHGAAIAPAIVQLYIVVTVYLGNDDVATV